LILLSCCCFLTNCSWWITAMYFTASIQQYIRTCFFACCSLNAIPHFTPLEDLLPKWTRKSMLLLKSLYDAFPNIHTTIIHTFIHIVIKKIKNLHIHCWMINSLGLSCLICTSSSFYIQLRFHLLKLRPSKYCSHKMYQSENKKKNLQCANIKIQKNNLNYRFQKSISSKSLPLKLH